MDFIEELRNLSPESQGKKMLFRPKRQRKNAFVMPFINLLGYDVFNPTEVVPEFTADVGTNRVKRLTMLFSKMMKSSCSLSAKSMVQIYLMLTLPNFTVIFQLFTLESLY